MLANARLGPPPERRLEQHVDGAVEFLFRRFDVPLLELFLARFEVAIRGRNQRQDRVFNRGRRDLLNGRRDELHRSRRRQHLVRLRS